MTTFLLIFLTLGLLSIIDLYSKIREIKNQLGPTEKLACFTYDDHRKLTQDVDDIISCFYHDQSGNGNHLKKKTNKKKRNKK